MIRLSIVLLALFVCLTVSLVTAQTQNQSKTLGPNASLSETLDWLKSRIPYSYTQAMDKERRVLQRHAIGHLKAKGCTLTYDVTIETVNPGSTSVETMGNELEQQLWRIDLKGLNPRRIIVEPRKGNRPPRILFSSFDPEDPDFLSKVEPGKPHVELVVPNKTIWHSDRMGGRRVRGGEGFVSWTSFSVRDEAKGQEIAAALKHAIGLCRQVEAVNSGPQDY
jgi:hypothetical protein